MKVPSKALPFTHSWNYAPFIETPSTPKLIHLHLKALHLGKFLIFTHPMHPMQLYGFLEPTWIRSQVFVGTKIKHQTTRDRTQPINRSIPRCASLTLKYRWYPSLCINWYGVENKDALKRELFWRLRPQEKWKATWSIVRQELVTNTCWFDVFQTWQTLKHHWASLSCGIMTFECWM